MSVARRARAWLAVSVAVAITASVAIGGAAHAANDAPKGKVAYDKNADLTFAYAAGPHGFDPVRPGYLFPFMALIYDRLTQINDNLEVEPMLAAELGVREGRLDARVQAPERRHLHRRDEDRRGRGEGEPRPSARRAVQHAPDRAQVGHERHRGQSHDGAAHAGSRPGRATPVGPRVEPGMIVNPKADRRPQRRPHAGTGRRQRVGPLQARVRDHV